MSFCRAISISKTSNGFMNSIVTIGLSYTSEANTAIRNVQILSNTEWDKFLNMRQAEHNKATFMSYSADAWEIKITPFEHKM